MRKGNILLPVHLLVESEDQFFAWVDFQWIGWRAFGRPDERILHLVPDFCGVPLIDIFPGKHLFPGFIPVLRLDVPDNQPVRHHIYRVILPAGVAERLAVVVRYGRMGLAIIINPVWFYPKRPADSVHGLTPSTLVLFINFFGYISFHDTTKNGPRERRPFFAVHTYGSGLSIPLFHLSYWAARAR